MYITICVVTFRAKGNVRICVKKLLQIALKKLLRYASKVVKIRVNFTFYVKSCHILR